MLSWKLTFKVLLSTMASNSCKVTVCTQSGEQDLGNVLLLRRQETS